MLSFAKKRKKNEIASLQVALMAEQMAMPKLLIKLFSSLTHGLSLKTCQAKTFADRMSAVCYLVTWLLVMNLRKTGHSSETCTKAKCVDGSTKMLIFLFLVPFNIRFLCTATQGIWRIKGILQNSSKYCLRSWHTSCSSLHNLFHRHVYPVITHVMFS